MDVSTQTLIETGLNVAGFLTAAGIWSLLTSRNNHRAKSAEEEEDKKHKPIPELTVDPIESVATGESGDMAFINFNSAGQTAEIPSRRESRKREIPSHLKGRAETIRLAKRMLAGGSKPEDIKRSLPITDGEIALLQGV